METLPKESLVLRMMELCPEIQELGLNSVYYPGVEGPKQCGQGRRALMCLKSIFRGEVFVEDPGRVIRVANADQASLPFWIEMHLEGNIDALESEHVSLRHDSPREEVERLLREMTQRPNVAQGDVKNAGEGKSQTVERSR